MRLVEGSSERMAVTVVRVVMESEVEKVMVREF